MNEFFTTGALKDKKDKRDFRACGVVATPKVYEKIFDLEEKFPPKMQWGRGSCTGQGFAHHKERQEGIPMSARFGMAMVKTFLEKNTNYGGYTRNQFKSCKKYGIAEERIYPEPEADMSWKTYVDANTIPEKIKVDALKHKIESYWSVAKIINHVKDVLLTGNSVDISMGWYSVFNKPMEDGTLPSYDRSSYSGGHNAEIVGWNDKKELLKFKNSWSKSWGKDGYFYMPYDFFKNLVWDLWTSLDIPKEVPVDNLYGHIYQPIDTWRDLWVRPKVLFKYKRLPSRRELNALLNYWDFESVFEGKNGDLWLYYTHIDANKKGLLINNKIMNEENTTVEETVEETKNIEGLEATVPEGTLPPNEEEIINPEGVAPASEPVEEVEEPVEEVKPKPEPVPSFL